MQSVNEKSQIDSIGLFRAARANRTRTIAVVLRLSGRRVVRFLNRRVLRPVQAHFERQRSFAELMNMDDRMLRDMGISRGTIFRAIEHGREPANTNVPLKPANTNAPLKRPDVA